MTLFDDTLLPLSARNPLAEPGSGRGGIGAHQSAAMKNDEWLTPPHILEALGPFDLDPCAPVSRPWPMASEHYTAADNGLQKPWHGRVWLNPPYGQETARWMQRLAEHGNGIALIFARTETAIFFPWVWEHATAWFFLQGRLHFHFVDGTRARANSGAPSMLVAYGEANAEAMARSGLQGKILRNTDQPMIAPSFSPDARAPQDTQPVLFTPPATLGKV